MKIAYEEIQKKVLDCLISKYNIDLKKEQYNENLFGNKMRLNARSLIDIIMEMEKYFQVEISENDLNSIDILSVNGISSAIFKSI